MSTLIESPKNEISIYCSGLSNEDLAELELFLGTQPGVVGVHRRYQVRDHAPSKDTLGFLTGPVYHFVVEVTKGMARSVIANAILEQIKTRFPAKKTAQVDASLEKQDQEYEWVLGWDGSQIRSVKRPRTDD
jgi:hypothetical protein